MFKSQKINSDGAFIIVMTSEFELAMFFGYSRRNKWFGI